MLTSLKENWSTLKTLHGNLRDLQSQTSVERANQNAENMLRTLMQDKKNPLKWGIAFRLTYED